MNIAFITNVTALLVQEVERQLADSGKDGRVKLNGGMYAHPIEIIVRVYKGQWSYHIGVFYSRSFPDLATLFAYMPLSHISAFVLLLLDVREPQMQYEGIIEAG